jgi:hypothetical protein
MTFGAVWSGTSTKVEARRASMVAVEHLAAVIWLLIGLNSACAGVEGVPVIPVGDDAYLKWEDWPLQRVGMRAYIAAPTIEPAATNGRTRPISSINWQTTT